MPFIAQGPRTEPLVSVPSAPGTSRAATATAEPPLLPPAITSARQGFTTKPK
jgi:hypothetical protein